MTNESEIYLQNRNKLKEVVSKIKNMDTFNVDELIPLTSQGLEAIQVCMSRIDAVEQQLDLSLKNIQQDEV